MPFPGSPVVQPAHGAVLRPGPSLRREVDQDVAGIILQGPGQDLIIHQSPDPETGRHQPTPDPSILNTWAKRQDRRTSTQPAISNRNPPFLEQFATPQCRNLNPVAMLPGRPELPLRQHLQGQLAAQDCQLGPIAGPREDDGHPELQETRAGMLHRARHPVQDRLGLEQGNMSRRVWDGNLDHQGRRRN